MNLHEYQAKQIFADYGLPVPTGQIVQRVEDLSGVTFNGDKMVVKAQVHAGGRGKAGGVKIVSNKPDMVAAAQKMLGSNLITYQTTSQGQPVNTVLIENACDIARELYLGAVIDRDSGRLAIMASAEGGVEIEKIAADTPEKIFTLTVNPLTGVMPYQARELGFALGLSKDKLSAFSKILFNIGRMFVDKDMALLEINPLVITSGGEILCLDGKINIDSNALYRQQALADMQDKSQEDERELWAQQWDLSYVSLDGDIGCMVNGAGLAMATMDLIKLHGGNPANFLDVGGAATAERVAEALRIILADKKVKGVLVNIFGGIVRCDLIAEGIIEAVSKSKISVPIVVRLEGNNAELGAQKLLDSAVEIIVPDSLTDASQKIIEAVK